MTKPANGAVPASALVIVQSGTFAGHGYSIPLETATAAAFKRAQAAGGLTISPDLGGYRDEAAQMDLHLHPAAHGSNLKPAQIRATGSTHGWGDCVDIAAGNAWFQTHCGEYGFVRESPAGESNHYRFTAPTWAPAIPPTSRRAAVELNRLAAPTTASAILEFVPAGGVCPMQGYVDPTVPHDPAIQIEPIGAAGYGWFVSTAGGFMAIPNFDDPHTHDLPDLTAALFPVPAEPTPLPPTAPPAIDDGPQITEVPDPALDYTPPATPAPAQPSGFAAFIQAIVAAILGSRK